MIPDTVDYFSQDENSVNFEVAPTKTYKIDWVNKRIIGIIEDRESVLQFVKKVFNTDKYAFEIYDWYYGNEVLSLVGQSMAYAIARLPNIAREALLVDDRILDVTDFSYTQTAIDTLVASFVVVSIYGEIEYSLEVKI